MKEISLTFIFDETNKEVINASFNEEEERLLELYLENVARLAESPFIKNGVANTYSAEFGWDAQSGNYVKATPIDDVILNDLLHRARLVFLFKEPASFEKTCALVKRCLRSSESMVGHLKSLNKYYTATIFDQLLQFQYNDISLLNNEGFNLWLNATNYHQDLEKRELIKKIDALVSQEITRPLFIQIIIGKLDAIFSLKGIVAHICDQLRK